MEKESLVAWVCGTDMVKFGKSVVLVHDLFVDYSCYCGRMGFKGKDVATARGMSDYLESIGLRKKRTCDGMAFVVV